MLFTNTYTAHDYTLEHNETEHWDACGCGDVQNREAHRYGEWTVTKEATETESGEKEHTCTVCGYTQTAEIEKLPHIHDYTLEHNETEHWDACGCGDVQNREAHRYGEWTVTKEATETESGEKEHTCTVCGYTQTAEIEKLPHIHDYTLEHNETEHWNACGCGDVQNREAHRYGEWIVTKEATETESGEKEHTCTVCGYTQTAEIEKLPAAEPNTDTDTSADNTDTPTEDTTSPKPDDNRTGSTTSPKTGNNGNITLWLGVMAAAGAALVGTHLYNRKKKYSR